jgi:GNAT superfamily N-acetyltransferase
MSLHLSAPQPLAAVHILDEFACGEASLDEWLERRALTNELRGPVPVMVLTRLAIDHRAQGIGLGAALLQDAVNRAAAVSQNVGVRALLVHALHERAKAFYKRYGFQESPQHPMTLLLRLNAARA